MTRSNAEELIIGLNDSEATKQIGVGLGGTNNAEFIDNEILVYDAQNKRIISSGYTPQTIGLASVFVPYVTGVAFSNSGVDLSNTSSESMALVVQSFSLPANAFWVDLDLTFGFRIFGSGSSMSDLGVHIGSDSGVAASIVTSYSGPFEAVDDTDSSWVAWRATGSIPLTHILDDPLIVTIKGVPQDIATCRSCVTRIGYRASVAPPVGGGVKGVPVFFATPTTIPNGPGATWNDFDITELVPAGASAVLIHAWMWSNELGAAGALLFRAGAGSNEYRVVYVLTNNDEDDQDSDTNQCVFPYKSLSGVRSIQTRWDGAFNGLEIKLIGYIT